MEQKRTHRTPWQDYYSLPSTLQSIPFRRGVDLYEQVAYEKSLLWFQQAAQNGYQPAYLFLDLLRQKGFRVSESTEELATIYYESLKLVVADLAKLTDPNIVFDLGLYCFAINNYAKAMECLHRAAMLGHAEAQYHISVRLTAGPTEKLELKDFIFPGENARLSAGDWCDDARCQYQLWFSYKYGMFKESGLENQGYHYELAEEYFKRAAANRPKRTKVKPRRLRAKQDQQINTDSPASSQEDPLIEVPQDVKPQVVAEQIPIKDVQIQPVAVSVKTPWTQAVGRKAPPPLEPPKITVVETTPLVTTQAQSVPPVLSKNNTPPVNVALITPSWAQRVNSKSPPQQPSQVIEEVGHVGSTLAEAASLTATQQNVSAVPEEPSDFDGEQLQPGGVADSPKQNPKSDTVTISTRKAAKKPAVKNQQPGQKDFELGLKFLNERKFPEALESFKQSSAADPSYRIADIFICKLYVERPAGIDSNPEELGAYRQKTKRNKDWFVKFKKEGASKHYYLGFYYQFVEEKLEEAITWFVKAAECHHAQALEHIKKYNTEIRACRRAKAIREDKGRPVKNCIERFVVGSDNPQQNSIKQMTINTQALFGKEIGSILDEVFALGGNITFLRDPDVFLPKPDIKFADTSKLENQEKPDITHSVLSVATISSVVTESKSEVSSDADESNSSDASAASNQNAQSFKQEPLAPIDSVSSFEDQAESINSHHLVLPPLPKADYKASQQSFTEGLALYCQAEYQKALVHFEQVHWEKFPVVCIYLSLLYQGVEDISQGMPKSALWLEKAKNHLGWFQQIEKKRQKTAEDYYCLGLYYQFLGGKGKRKQAVDCYKNAMKFVPAEASYRLGMYYVEKKNAGEARTYLEKAVAQDHKPAIAALENLLQENPQLLLSNAVSNSTNVSVSSSRGIEPVGQEVVVSSSSIENAAASSHTTTSPLQVVVETNIQVEGISNQQNDNLIVDAETPVARPTHVGLPSEANVEVVSEAEPAPVVAETNATKPTIPTKPKKPEDHFNDGRKFYEQDQSQNALASFLLAAGDNHKAAYPYVCELYVERPGGIEKDDNKLNEYRKKAQENRKWFMDLKGKSSDKLRCLARYYRYVEGNVELADKYDNLAAQKQEKNKLAAEKASVDHILDDLEGLVQSCSSEGEETSVRVNQEYEHFKGRVLRDLARIDEVERQAKSDTKAEAKADEMSGPSAQEQIKLDNKEEQGDRHLPKDRGQMQELSVKIMQSVLAGRDQDARQYAAQGLAALRQMGIQRKENAPYPLRPNRAKKSSVPTLDEFEKQRSRDLYGNMAGQGFFGTAGIPVDNQSAQKVKSHDAKAKTKGQSSSSSFSLSGQPVKFEVMQGSSDMSGEEIMHHIFSQMKK